MIQLIKKTVCSFLIISCLSLTNSKVAFAYSVNVFKEGIYKPINLNLTSDRYYFIRNVSRDNPLVVLVFDENHIVIQSVRLAPKSEKFTLHMLKPEYKLVLIGNGELYID